LYPRINNAAGSVIALARTTLDRHPGESRDPCTDDAYFRTVPWTCWDGSRLSPGWRL